MTDQDPKADEATGVAVADQMVTLSRNETESLGTKAARGAGFSWGLAEEAGFALGWLAVREIDASSALLKLLEARDADPSRIWAPRVKARRWKSADALPLCPIATGAALLDSALLVGSPFEHDTAIGTLIAPILALPFVARAAGMRRDPVIFECDEVALRVSEKGEIPFEAASQLASRVTGSLRLVAGTVAGAPNEPRRGLATVATSVLRRLDSIALRTTVPATESSRRGAGSTATDND